MWQINNDDKTPENIDSLTPDTSLKYLTQDLSKIKKDNKVINGFNYYFKEFAV